MHELVKKMVEWKLTDRWDEENNWLLEGRTVLIFKGGDRNNPANYRPVTCLPTITKKVTLASHEWCGNYYGNGEQSILELEPRASGPPRDIWRLRLRTLPLSFSRKGER